MLKRYVPCALLVLSAVIGFAATTSDSRVADAAQNQDRALVRSLLKQHADVNGLQADRATALIWAAHWGDAEMVDVLLAAGANAKLANRYGTSALTEAADIANVLVMEKLLKAGADANSVSQNSESVLMSVARAGSVEGVKLLLDHGADINAHDAKDDETPLMYAVYEGQLPVVKLLIAKGADVNAVAHTLDIPRRSQPSFSIFGSRITGGFVALTFAARQDYFEIAQALLDAGANPNVADRDGMTPLIVSCLNGSFDTAAVLLNKGADPNDGSMWEAVEFRNYKGNDENGRVVMDKSTSKVDALELIQLMLAKGADPTKPYGKLRTLHKYAATGAGAPVSTSALDHALDSVDADAVRLMLTSATARGIKFDATAILGTGVRAYSGQAVGPGKMLFRTATTKDVADIVAMAIGSGADVNNVNLLGVTPLHMAAQQGADELVTLLAAKGAKLDAKNKAGLTPMDFAMGKGGPLNAGGRRGPAPEDEAEAPATAHASTIALLRQLMAAPEKK